MPVAMERVLARLNRGEAPPSVTLPEFKAEFPKLLYLDMWVWVELSRVHYGLNQAPAAVAALAAIRDALQAKRAVVPMATVNLDEATKHSDEDRRKRLAEFMVDLCREAVGSLREPDEDRGALWDEGRRATERHSRSPEARSLCLAVRPLA
jgi:hypothetical protein